MKKRRRRIKSVDELVSEWTQVSNSSQELLRIRDLIARLDHELFREYEPIAAKAPFMERLAHWLQNVSSRDCQQTMLELVPWLLFFGNDELRTLYRAALTGPITRWIIDQVGIDLADRTLTEQVNREFTKTFFCSIAGMKIDEFVRVNSISSQGDRPNLRETARIGDPCRFAKDLVDRGYVRVIAVEDMVGTGTQMREAVPTIAALAPLPVLLCPLIVAPQGVKCWSQDLKPLVNMAHVSFSPLFVIPDAATIPLRAVPGEFAEIARFRRLLKKTWKQVQGLKPGKQLFGAFGFGDFGSVVLSAINCPDNVPPMLHYGGDQWDPLFPRVPREG